MQIVEIKHGSEEYKMTLDLRNQVLRIPLGMRLSDNDIAGEQKQLHFGLFQDSVLVASVIFKPLCSKKVKLRQMAVHTDFQGCGYGAMLVNLSEQKIFGLGYKEIEMAARETAVGFYQKLGYSKQGEKFTEIGIPHFHMVKQNCYR